MTSHPPIDLQLEISSIEEPIQGRLSRPDGRSVDFTGWLELSSALSSIAAGGAVHNNINDKEAHDGH